MSRTIRRKYSKSKAFDKSCRNAGNCPWCKSNRQIANKKREESADEQIQAYKEIAED